MGKRITLTKEAYKKLMEELQFLATTKRKEIALRFKEAFETDGFPDGDMLDEETFVENRIRQLNDILNRAKIIEQKEVQGDRIKVGSRFVLKDLETEEEMEFVLTSSVEANLSQNRLSEDSPVGKALRGKRIGQVVRVKAPGGRIKYQVVRLGRQAQLCSPGLNLNLPEINIGS